MKTDDVKVGTIDVLAEDGDWDRWLALVRRHDARVVVSDQGAPIAVLVPVSDYQRLDRFDSARRALRGTLDDFQQSFADVSLDEIEREVTRARAEVRREVTPAPDAAPH